MDALELYRLGRRLMKIGEHAIAGSEPARVPSGVRLILEDIATHPSSTIGEITTRTGFPQSHVSASVARFRERGAVETEVDPDDGRRTLVRLHPDFLRSTAERGAVPVEEALSEALDISDARVLAEIIATLESLAGRVLGAEGSEARPTPPRPGRATGPRGVTSESAHVDGETG
jgi:DNA-binding MarR family transcriptional regulator